MLDLAMHRRTVHPGGILTNRRRTGCNCRWARVNKNEVVARHNMHRRWGGQAGRNRKRVSCSAEIAIVLRSIEHGRYAHGRQTRCVKQHGQWVHQHQGFQAMIGGRLPGKQFSGDCRFALGALCVSAGCRLRA